MLSIHTKDYTISKQIRTHNEPHPNDVKTITEGRSPAYTFPASDGWERTNDFTLFDDNKQRAEDLPYSNIQPGAWDADIHELDEFFSMFPIVDTSLKINPWTIIENIPAYLSANLEVARAQNGNPTYLPYLMRAIELKKYLEDHRYHM